MAEQDELGRSLALARATLRGPAAMKQRVRAQLAAGALAARVPASPASTGPFAAGRHLLARRYHLATVAVLVGVGFGAGFWLGRVPSEPLRNGAAEATHASPSRAPTVSAPGAPDTGSHGAVGADAAGSAEPASSPGSAAPDASEARSTPTPHSGASERAAHAAATGDGRAHAAPRATISTTSTQAASRRRPEPRAARAASDDALMREVALLERIDRAIRAGEGGLAAALLDELDRSLPAPALSHERTAARVLARCVVARAGSSSTQQQARANAERFLAREPTSVYADRVRAACPLEGADTNGRPRIEERFRVGHSGG